MNGNVTLCDPELNTETFTILADHGHHSIQFKAKKFWEGKWTCQMDDSDNLESGTSLGDDLKTSGIFSEITR